jgi:hypothetical protein
MRATLALLFALVAAAPATAATAPPRHLFVLGDSVAYDNRFVLQHKLTHWKIESDFSFARSSRQTADDLQARSHADPPLPPVIHVSSGVGDDPANYEGFRRSIRRVMRIAGRHRCVVWANVWRLRLQEPTYATINFVLAAEAAARPNLRLVDWFDMVEAHNEWLVDAVHVNEEGNRARGEAVAREVRLCRQYLQ